MQFLENIGVNYLAVSVGMMHLAVVELLVEEFVRGSKIDSGNNKNITYFYRQADLKGAVEITGTYEFPSFSFYI